MSGSIEDTKEELWRQIREMQERHRQELEPFIKILTDIRALEPPEPIIIDFSQLTDQQRADWLGRLKSSGVLADETE